MQFERSFHCVYCTCANWENYSRAIISLVGKNAANTIRGRIKFEGEYNSRAKSIRGNTVAICGAYVVRFMRFVFFEQICRDTCSYIWLEAQGKKRGHCMKFKREKLVDYACKTLCYSQCACTTYH